MASPGIVAAACHGQSAAGAAVTATLFFLLVLVAVGNLVVTRFRLYIVLTASALSALPGTSSGVLISIKSCRQASTPQQRIKDMRLDINKDEQGTPASGTNSGLCAAYTWLSGYWILWQCSILWRFSVDSLYITVSTYQPAVHHRLGHE